MTGNRSIDLTGSAYLEEEYGRSTACLAGRCSFYDRFRSGTPSWQEWLSGELLTTGKGRVLDVGCGDGTTWAAARGGGLLPEGISVLLVDRSKPMVDACRKALSGDPRFSVVHAEAIAWMQETDAVFDLILAGHMVYHLDDPEAFVRFAWERLKPGGELALTSVGQDHLAALAAALESFFVEIGVAPPRLTPPTFRTPETLETLLRGRFSDIRTHAYRADLSIDDAGSLADFLASRVGGSARAMHAMTRFAAQDGLLPLKAGVHNLLTRGRKHG